MAVSKQQLKEIGRFHLADPTTLEGTDEWTLWLESILHDDCSIFERDGEWFLIETKQLVDRLNGLRIEIYPKEHSPPHFHVKAPGLDASFAIEDCRLLKGAVDGNVIRKVQYWHRYSKPMLIEAWNSTRPTDCAVGNYHPGEA
jgi:hypothetical protein